MVLYDELTKRAFWKLGIVTELLTGQDGLTRAAIVKTVNCDKTSYLRRSIKHLIPIELSMTTTESNEGTAVTLQNDQPSEETTRTTPHPADDTTNGERPPRRAAAIRGEQQRRQS